MLNWSIPRVRFTAASDTRNDKQTHAHVDHSQTPLRQWQSKLRFHLCVLLQIIRLACCSNLVQACLALADCQRQTLPPKPPHRP